MGGVLYTCGDLGALADRLAKDLQQEVADPLQPIHIIVPHPLTDAWLKRRIAQQMGVVMNLRGDYPGHGFWRALASLDPQAASVRPIDRPELELLIALVLLTAGPDDVDLEPLLEYCGLRGPRYWRRVWQLSQQLSEGFLDYEQHMPELVDAWVEGRLLDPEDPTERAQAELYRRALPRPEASRLSLAGYARHALGRLLPPREPVPRLYVFGLSLFSRLQLSILAAVARHIEVLIYYAPPVPVGPSPWSAHDDAARIIDQWSRTTRATWAQLQERLLDPGLFKHTPLPMACSEAGETSDLRRIQRALTGRHDGGAPAGDGSFRVLSSSSAVREMEAIRDDILQGIEGDASLILDDIAVLVADPEEYAVAARSVFSAASPPIPHNLSGLDPGGSSAYAQAVEALLQMASGHLDRGAVFSLLGNPCFLAAGGFGRADITTWRSWAESLSVYHSWDASIRRERGFGASDRFTWRQGLRRLRLGQVMDESALDEGAFAEVPPFRDLESGDREAVAAFDRTVEGLLRSVASWSREGFERPAAEWTADLLRLLDTYLAVPPDRPLEESVVAAAREGLLAIAEHLGDAAVGLSLVSDALLARLGTAAAPAGRPLEGVTIARLAMPLCLPPFRVVYLAGFNELAFPGSVPRMPLNLRRTRGRDDIRQLWPPDHHRHLGLEACLRAGDALRISTLGRDLQKDEEHFPSPMLAQLMRLMGWLDADGELPASLSVQVPLHASSRECLDDASPSRTYSSWDQILGWRWRAQREGADLAPALAQEVRLAAEERLAVRRLDSDLAMPGRERERERVPLGRLSKFLEEPLAEALRRHLRIKEDPSDGAAVEDREPLQAAFPEDYNLHVGALSTYVQKRAGEGAAVTLAEIAQQDYLSGARRGRLPEGPIGKVDLDHALSQLKEPGEWAEEYLAGLGKAEYAPRLILGGAQSREVPGVRVPATCLPLEDGRLAELRGSVEHWWFGHNEVHALCITRSQAPRTQIGPKGNLIPVFPRTVFLPFLMASALLVNDDAEARARIEGKVLFVDILPSPGGENTRGIISYGFGPLDRDRTASHLRDLCRDFLNPTCFQLLPFTPIADDHDAWSKVVDGEEASGYRDLILAVIEEDQERQPTRWRMPERVRLLRDLLAFVPDDPLAVLRSRFGPILEALVKEGE